MRLSQWGSSIGQLKPKYRFFPPCTEYVRRNRIEASESLISRRARFRGFGFEKETQVKKKSINDFFLFLHRVGKNENRHILSQGD